MFYGNANVISNTISNNQSVGGAGIFLLNSSPLIENNILANNSSSLFGGGILYLANNSNANIVGNLIANNDANGISIYYGSAPTIVNSTITNNYSYYAAGMVFDQGSDPVIKNCIVYGNMAQDPSQGSQIRIIDADSDPIFDHCDIQGGLAGFGGAGAGSNYNPANYTNNINTDPIFVDPTTGAGAGYDGLLADYSVQGNSPCIDAGTTSGIINILPALDLAGNPRINGIIDMGSYEYCSPAQPSTITGNANPCEGSAQVYSVTNVSGITYTWTVPTGSTITAGQGSNSITVTIGSSSGNITVTPSNSCGNGTPRTLAVTVNALPAQPSAITGDANPCQGSSQVYSVTNVSGITYTWAVPSSWTITAGQGSNAITVTVGSAYGNISVIPANSCGDGNAQSLAVTVNTTPANAGTITGPVQVCKGSDAIVYTVPIIANATSYDWTLPNGASGTSTSNSIAVDFGLEATSGEISVKGLNDCGEGEASSLFVQVNPLPEAAALINGTAVVCAGSANVAYSTPALADADAYIWTLPAGASGNSTTNSIIVDFGAEAVSGEISVKGVNDCGEGEASSLFVEVIHVPDQASEIIGNTNPCEGYTGIYEVTQVEGIIYTWTVPPGATILDGQGSNAVVVNIGTSSGDITVTPSNLCGNGLESSLFVTVNHPPSDTPTQASGPETVNSFNTATSLYTTNAVPNTNDYLWDLYPAEAGVLSPENDTSVTVTWNTGFTGNCALVVKAVNNCGESPFSVPIIIYVDYLTSLLEVSTPQINIYPNPSNGRFVIESSNTITEVKLFDVSGRCLFVPATENQAEITLDLNLAEGLYFVHVCVENVWMVHKISISR